MMNGLQVFQFPLLTVRHCVLVPVCHSAVSSLPAQARLVQYIQVELSRTKLEETDWGFTARLQSQEAAFMGRLDADELMWQGCASGGRIEGSSVGIGETFMQKEQSATQRETQPGSRG